MPAGLPGVSLVPTLPPSSLPCLVSTPPSCSATRCLPSSAPARCCSWPLWSPPCSGARWVVGVGRSGARRGSARCPRGLRCRQLVGTRRIPCTYLQPPPQTPPQDKNTVEDGNLFFGVIFCASELAQRCRATGAEQNARQQLTLRSSALLPADSILYQLLGAISEMHLLVARLRCGGAGGRLLPQSLPRMTALVSATLTADQPHAFFLPAASSSSRPVPAAATSSPAHKRGLLRCGALFPAPLHLALLYSPCPAPPAARRAFLPGVDLCGAHVCDASAMVLPGGHAMDPARV